MNVLQFRKKIKAGAAIIVDGQEFDVREVVLFRFDDKSYYIKCFLTEGYVLADDATENAFVLVKEVETGIERPFPEELEYDGKDFEFLFDAHATAEQVSGEEIFKEGESETFWDYEAEDGSYLNLGVHDATGQRQDFYGKYVDDIEFPEMDGEL